MNDYFISYSQKDFNRVKKIIKALKTCGCKLWWDERGENSDFHHENIHSVIDNKISASKKVIACWSPNYVKSSYCQGEASEALKQKKIILIIIDPAGIDKIYRNLPFVDFSKWNCHSDSQEIKIILNYLSLVNPAPNEGIVDETHYPKLIWKTHDEACFTEKKYSYEEAQHQVKETNDKAIYGLKNWRIPEKGELVRLRSLVDSQPNEDLNIKEDIYWSDTHHKLFDNKIWGFHMGYNYDYSPLKTLQDTLQLRLVCNLDK